MLVELNSSAKSMSMYSTASIAGAIDAPSAWLEANEQRKLTIHRKLLGTLQIGWLAGEDSNDQTKYQNN